MTVEHRTPPADPALHDAARYHPGKWIYDIDWPYPAAQRTPPEAIRGGWEVGPDRRLTDLFTPNARYRPIEQCSHNLKPYVHAAAETNRDQWIVEIDPRGEDRFPDIPETLIQGGVRRCPLKGHRSLPTQLALDRRPRCRK